MIEPIDEAQPTRPDRFWKLLVAIFLIGVAVVILNLALIGTGRYVLLAFAAFIEVIVLSLLIGRLYQHYKDAWRHHPDTDESKVDPPWWHDA